MFDTDRLAHRMLEEHFQNAPLICRVQIWPPEERGPHRFYYIGYRDVFGAQMPEPPGRGFDYQIWGTAWVRGRSKKIDAAIDAAMKGKFRVCRHNQQLKLRAKRDGKQLFQKPVWQNAPPKTTPASSEAEKLPLRRKRKKTRPRRKLTI